MYCPYPHADKRTDPVSLVSALLTDLADQADLSPTWRRCATYWANAVHPGISAVSARSIAWVLADVDRELNLCGENAGRLQGARLLLLHDALRPSTRSSPLLRGAEPGTVPARRAPAGRSTPATRRAPERVAQPGRVLGRTGEISAGATVVLRFGDETTETVQVNPADNADLTVAAPLTQALLGRRVGDTIAYHTSGGEGYAEVVAVDTPRAASTSSSAVITRTGAGGQP